MPTSFDAMYEETRPRSLVDEPREPRPARVGVALAAVLLIAFPLVAAALL